MNRRSAVLLLCAAALAPPPLFDAKAGEQGAADVYGEARAAVARAYGGEHFDPASWLKRVAETGTDADIPTLLATLDDHSVRWLRAEEAQNFMAQMGDSPSPGIGLIELLCVDFDETDARATIVTPVPGTPAARAGLRTGDVIAAIDGVPTAGMSLHRIAHAMQGAPGTALSIAIERAGKTMPIPLTRAAFPSEQAVVASKLVAIEGESIGYVGILRFTPESGAEAERAIAGLVASGARHLVIDLRNNPGGALSEAVAVAELFLPQGTRVASLRSRGSIVRTFDTARAARFDLPVAVLQNAGSASAAEMLASTLRGAGGAVVLGERSFGKGLVHTAETLSDKSVVMMPAGKLISTEGTDILANGIAPDHHVEDEGTPVVQGTAASAGDAMFRRAAALLLESER